MFIDEIIFDLYNKISGVYMKKRRLELPSEQAAYWLIKTYIAKAYEISRDKSSFSKDEQEFSRIIRSVNDSNWNIIFVILSNCIRRIINRESFTQSTLKDQHNVTNLILQEAFSRIGISEKIPNINLTKRQGNFSTLDMEMNSKNAFISFKNDRYKLPKYIENYDFVLTSDDDELRFYNLILSIIVSVRRKDNRFNSLNMIKEVFCERANLEDASEVFDRVIEVFTEYSIIKLESRGKENIITTWPIDEGITGEEYFSDIIIRKYKEAMDSRIKEYVPPSTREERRRFTGKAKARKNKALSREADSFSEDKKTGAVKESIKRGDKKEKTPSKKELGFLQNYTIPVNIEGNTYFFILEESIVTLRNRDVTIIIDLSDNSVITQFKCEDINNRSVTLERKIAKGPRIIYDIVKVRSKEFNSDEFRVRYYKGEITFTKDIDKYIVRMIETTNLWTKTSETKEKVLEAIRNRKNDFELIALIERIDNDLLPTYGKTSEGDKGKSPYVKQ